MGAERIRIAAACALLASAMLAIGSGSSASAQSLDATDPVEIDRAITAAARPNDRAAALLLVDRIHRGLPGQLLAHAIDALVENHSQPAISALIELSHHRRAQVRARVSTALARTRSQSARDVLADRLDDPDAEVRSAAAVALGEVGAQGMMDTVLLAALRGVPEAAIVYGEQATPADIARLLRRVDRSTFEAVAPALRILLGRANVPRGQKLAIVRTIGALEDPFADRLLREIGAALLETDPVRRAIDEALATEGEAPATPGAAPAAGAPAARDAAPSTPTTPAAPGAAAPSPQASAPATGARASGAAVPTTTAPARAATPRTVAATEGGAR
jgi:HEAT repeat protein